MSKEPERAVAGKSIAKPGRMMRPDECTVVVRVGSVRLVGLFDILCALRYHPEHVVAKGWALPGNDLFNPPRSFLRMFGRWQISILMIEASSTRSFPTVHVSSASSSSNPTRPIGLTRSRG